MASVAALDGGLEGGLEGGLDGGADWPVVGATVGVAGSQAAKESARIAASATERKRAWGVMGGIVTRARWRPDPEVDVAFLIAWRLDRESRPRSVAIGQNREVPSSLPPTGGADWAGASGLSLSRGRRAGLRPACRVTRGGPSSSRPGGSTR